MDGETVWEFVEVCRKVRVGKLRRLWPLKQLKRRGLLSDSQWNGFNRIVKKKSGPYGPMSILRSGNVICLASAAYDTLDKFDRKFGVDWDKKVFPLISDPNIPNSFQIMLPIVA